MRWTILLATLCLAAVTGCKKEQTSADAEDLRPRSEPIEFVTLKVSQNVEHGEVLKTLGTLFPKTAPTAPQITKLQPGVTLAVSPDTRTADQIVLSMDMQTTKGKETRRVLAVPASLETGHVYLAAIEAALARTDEVIAEGDQMSDWHLEYNSVSFNGGVLKIEVGHKRGVTTLTFETANPQTSLFFDEINRPAFKGDPYEFLSGTVFFSLDVDQFSFFSHRAYGVTAGAAQNFEDFQLQPHNWLRITVVPQLPDPVVDVNFEVVTVKGDRVPLASSPASLLAGEQFQQNVFRLAQNMEEQEAKKPGSSSPFESVFHYDDPMGGGAVKVIFQGDGGQYRVAYTVHSPLTFLRDTAYVPYTVELDLPDPDEQPTEASCADFGSKEANKGRFVLTFDASETVRDSALLSDPLRGKAIGAIYRDADVTISGPNDGAESVASWEFSDVDIRNGPSTQFMVDTVLPKGEYQILGFLDIDDNETDDDPDQGDPVLIPIGAYKLKCAVHPINVEFALLLPANY